MTNAVTNAKLVVAPENSCTLDDIEICFKGVHEIYTVDEDGEWNEVKETYVGESHFSYYYCTNCGTEWHCSDGEQEELWKKVKEHIGENNS